MRSGQTRNRSRRHRAVRGFTMIEVLVALTIVMLGVAAFMSASRDSADVAGEAGMVEEALVRARSRMAIAAAQPFPGNFHGDDGGGFQWRTDTRLLGRHKSPQAGNETALYAISVWISWRGGRRVREVRLDTERLYTPLPDPTKAPDQP